MVGKADNGARMQVGKIHRQYKKGLSFLPLILFSLATVKSAQASNMAVSAGISQPEAMGYNYETLDGGVGLTADLMMELPVMKSNITQLQFSFGYDSYSIRNQTNLGLRVFEVLGGVQFINTKDYLHTITPFFGFQIGAAYNSLAYSGATAATSNSSMAFATQVAPGLDIPVYDLFGVVLQMPVKVLLFKSNIVSISPSISLRIKL